MTAPPDRANPPPGWQTQLPKYRATCDLWPPVKAQLRNALPIPRMADLDDVWQYAHDPIAAGDVIMSEGWPHPSLKPINESARRVHEYFLARNGKVWLPLRPWQDGRIVLDDKISIDSGDAA
jgi:hypothetical protein